MRVFKPAEVLSTERGVSPQSRPAQERRRTSSSPTDHSSGLPRSRLLTGVPQEHCWPEDGPAVMRGAKTGCGQRRIRPGQRIRTAGVSREPLRLLIIELRPQGRTQVEARKTNDVRRELIEGLPRIAQR